MDPNDKELTSSDIIMEEDEAYDHTSEEIIRYALYLGFELPEDEDLLYIAKEGLNAPVAHPWEVCQTESGEIYFYNTIDKQSTWNHPLDDHYRQIFQQAKKEKLGRPKNFENTLEGKQKKNLSGPFELRLSNDLQQTDEWNNIKGHDSKGHLSGFLESPIYANNQFELFKNVKRPLDEIGESQDIGEFRNRKQEEFLRRKKELEEIYQAKIDQAKEENERQLESLKEETQQKLLEEKHRAGQDISGKKRQPNMNMERNKKLEEFKEKMLEDLKKQKQATLEKIRGENEAKLVHLREELVKKREAKINEMKDELKKKQEDELKPLKEKLVEVQNEVKKLKLTQEQEDKLKSEEEKAFEAFKEEQERIFQDKKQGLVSRYEEKLKEMKKKEIDEYERKVDLLIEQNKLKSETNMKREQEKVRAELELENQKKLKMYEHELEKELEEAKREIAERISEVEKRKTEEVLTKLNAEYNTKLGEWLREKAREDEKFAKEKSILEQQYNTELSKYKMEFEKKIKNELEDLEAEKSEKVARISELDQAISDFARRIGLPNASNTKELQVAYENKLRDLTKALTKKNQELEGLTSKKFNLLTEVSSLKDKANLLKKECEDLQEQSDSDSLNNLLDSLTKKLLTKEQELQALKQERNTICNQSHNVSHYGLNDENKFISQPSQMDISGVSQNNDIEKIVKELESVKMVLENDIDDEEEAENESLRPRNMNQNKSFSHFGQPVAAKKAGLDRKAPVTAGVPDMEKQIRADIQELLAAKSKIKSDIAQFDKDCADSEFNPEVRAYYTGIRSAMMDNLREIDVKLQEREKFLFWTHKVKEEDVSNSFHFDKVNHTMMVERETNYDDYQTDDPLERMKSMLHGKRANRHSSLNKTTTEI